MILNCIEFYHSSNDFILHMKKLRDRENPLAQAQSVVQQQYGNYNPSLLSPPPPL